MLKSLLLAVLVLALAIALAWAVVHFGRAHGEPERKLRHLRLTFLLGGVVGAWFAFATDWGQRRTTLFEVLLEHAHERRELSFQVVHPGVPHVLRLAPKPGSGREAMREVSIALRLCEGERVLVDELRVFATRMEGTRTADRRRTWDAHAWTFTPRDASELTLILEPDASLPQLLVRVEDPELRDGQRAPGY